MGLILEIEYMSELIKQAGHTILKIPATLADIGDDLDEDVEGVPEEGVPEGIPEAVPEEAVPEEAVPEEAVPEEAVPEEAVPEAVPKEAPKKKSLTVKEIKKNLDNRGINYPKGGKKAELLAILKTAKEHVEQDGDGVPKEDAPKEDVKKKDVKKEDVKKTKAKTPSVKEIKKDLDGFGVEYPKGVKKAKLLEILESVRAHIDAGGDLPEVEIPKKKSLTVKEIKKSLDNLGINYPKGGKKAELLKILKIHETAQEQGVNKADENPEDIQDPVGPDIHPLNENYELPEDTVDYDDDVVDYPYEGVLYTLADGRDLQNTDGESVGVVTEGTVEFIEQDYRKMYHQMDPDFKDPLCFE
jgi:hypothetical protein